MEGDPVETSEAVAKGTVVQPPPMEVPPLASAPPIVKEEKKKMKVLVAVDNSEESFYALKWAVDNLFPSVLGGEVTEAIMDAGMLTILHVYNPFQNVIVPSGFGTAPVVFNTPMEMVEAIRRSQQKIATFVLARALEICKEKNIKAETMTLEGDAKYMICQATEETEVDLLVVGSRGLGLVKRLFLGSVSNYCARNIKCPVLIVKQHKKSQ